MGGFFHFKWFNIFFDIFSNIQERNATMDTESTWPVFNIELLIAGDKREQTKFVKKTRTKLLRKCNNDEEVLNNFYLKFFKNIKKYNPEFKLSTYCLVMMDNIIIDNYRKTEGSAKKLKTKAFSNFKTNYDLEPFAEITETLLYEDNWSKEQWQILHKEIELLSNEEKQVIELYQNNRLVTRKEMEQPITKTNRTKFHRIINKLKNKYNNK